MSGAAAGGAPEGEEPVTGRGGHDRDGGRRGGGEPAIGSGPGRALVAAYGLFTLAAGARAAVQIATRFSEAPLAYALSAFAAAVYLVLTVALARGNRRLALTACCVELAGVLVVGTLSMADPAAFPSATVWSGYGSGYVFIPLVLPFVGLYWLLRRR
ncbi:hypothetical protein GCM10027187_25680 [Streptosporangium sandarakinum]|uniref:Integral membrane protein n=1 Tax=Streptosporangium pseudovulgare TaxID=35765 RepID=A0ABQ2QNH4_9ACTN|nr:hypothetical protein GCM10010140_14830 [Streptosporangium pseudovulgare]